MSILILNDNDDESIAYTKGYLDALDDFAQEYHKVFGEIKEVKDILNRLVDFNHPNGKY